MEALAADPTLAPLPEYPNLVADLQAVTSVEEWEGWLAEAEADVSDPRVRCALQMAPLGVIVDPDSVTVIRRPLEVLWCDADEIAPPATNAAVYTAAPGATGRSLGETFGHYDFLGNPSLQQDAAAEAVKFFHRHLGG
jgi:predicted dienelactone hydrolase